MIFQFDPNSTKNEGRYRLRPVSDFVNDTFRTIKDRKNNINYIVGSLKSGDKAIQAIRFKKENWTEKTAGEWWKENQKMFTKKWSEKDWKRKQPGKIARSKALYLARKLAGILKIEYVNPAKITIDSRFIKGILIPVGSLRRERKEVGDIDVIVTKPITATTISNLNNPNIEDITGKDKYIDFKFLYDDTYININLFVFTDYKSWGAALLHTTGPGMYNQRLRNRLKGSKWESERGMGKGWKLSQKGLFKNDKLIPTLTERSLLKKMLVTERKPNER